MRVNGSENQILCGFAQNGNINYFTTHIDNACPSKHNIDMNKLPKDKRVQVVSALIEGCSIRSVCRMFKIGKNTVARLLVEVGKVCAMYHDEVMHNLECKRIQLDEIWSFVGCKGKNVPVEKTDEFGIGDVWTWVALDSDTKLVASWLVGLRDGGYATEFVQDLAGRLANRVQVTSDGHKAYLEAIEAGFGGDVDYAMLIKLYGSAPKDEAIRYSPAKCIGCERKYVTGNPHPDFVSTSYVERQNLQMRMSMRRFTRLTNGFSKKLENHCHAVALHFFAYNFIRVHGTLGTTPAVAAGVDHQVWTVEDLVDLVDAYAANSEK